MWRLVSVECQITRDEALMQQRRRVYRQVRGQRRSSRRSRRRQSLEAASALKQPQRRSRNWNHTKLLPTRTWVKVLRLSGFFFSLFVPDRTCRTNQTDQPPAHTSSPRLLLHTQLTRVVHRSSDLEFTHSATVQQCNARCETCCQTRSVSVRVHT